MAILNELVAITGKYTDKNGAEKNRYTKVGIVLETKGGSKMVKIECIPVGWDGFAYINDLRAKDDNTASQHNSSPPSDDDIPF